jgi:hypothetical protein
MTKPFEPIGDVARWVTIYQILAEHAVDEVVTYKEMADALDVDPDRDRRTIQGSIARAADELLKVDKHAIEAVPNVGYRIVQPDEQLRLGRGQQRRAGKALKKGHKVTTYVDMTGMDPETRKGFELLARAFAVQGDINRRLTARQDRMEAALQKILPRTDRHEEELAELRARLERVEQR